MMNFYYQEIKLSNKDTIQIFIKRYEVYRLEDKHSWCVRSKYLYYFLVYAKVNDFLSDANTKVAS